MGSISLMQWEISTKVNEKKIKSYMPRERALHFDQWKAFSENSKSMNETLVIAFVQNYWE